MSGTTNDACAPRRALRVARDRRAVTKRHTARDGIHRQMSSRARTIAFGSRVSVSSARGAGVASASCRVAPPGETGEHDEPGGHERIGGRLRYHGGGSERDADGVTPTPRGIEGRRTGGVEREVDELAVGGIRRRERPQQHTVVTGRQRRSRRCHATWRVRRLPWATCRRRTRIMSDTCRRSWARRILGS